MTNKEKVIYLSQYIRASKELEEVLEYYRGKAFDLQAQTISDMPSNHSCVPDKIGTGLANYEELKKLINIRLDGLFGKIVEIERLIDSTEDMDGKRIIRKKYLEGKTLRIIAREMYCSEKTIKRKHAMTVYALSI